MNKHLYFMEEINKNIILMYLKKIVFHKKEQYFYKVILMLKLNLILLVVLKLHYNLEHIIYY